MTTHTESWNDEGDLLGGRLLGELCQAAPNDRVATLGRYCDAYPRYAEEFRRMAEGQRLVGMGAPPVLEAEPPPIQLGAFRIEREMPHLGMGRIFEAVQEPLGRRVAIKTIRGELHRLSPEAEAKFMNEQRVLARLHHTNIVPIFTAGQEGDLHYFAMPYIDGASLSRLVRTAASLASTGSSEQTPSLAELARSTRDETEARKNEPPRDESLPRVGLEVVGGAAPAPARPARLVLSRKYLRSVASVMATAAEALQHAHDAHIIHRDVKPSNLMIDGAEHCWVIDFGLASLRNGATRAESDGDVGGASLDTLTHGGAGTPPYMAPEQFDQDRPLDARTDVWGLGVTLYELLAWRPAFSGRTIADLREKIETEEPAPLESLVRHLPHDLSLICRKAMHKDPARRHASAGEFAADLRCWLANKPTSVRRSGPRRAWLWTRRNPGWAVLVVLLLTSGFAAAAFERKRAQAAERVLALHDLQHSRLSRHEGGWSEDVWAKVKDLADDADGFDALLQHEAFGCLFGIDAKVARKFEISCRSLAIGPHGELLMGGVTDAPTNRRLLNARLWDGKSPLEPVELGVAEFGPVGFRGETPIQLVTDRQRRAPTLMDLKERRAIHEFEVTGTLDIADPAADEPMPAAMTPDGGLVGARILRKDGSPALAIWSGVSGRLLHEFPGEVTAIAFAPDGSLVAAGSKDGEVRVWDVASGATEASVGLGLVRITALAFGRNPRISHEANDPPTPRRRWQLAAGDAGATIMAWDLGRPRPRQLMKQTDGLYFEILSLAFSPDGTLLASGSRSFANLTDVSTGETLLGILTGNYPNAVTFASDGKRLIVGSEQSKERPDRNSVKVLDLEYGRGVRPFHGLATRPEHVFFSPGGKLVFAISQGYEIGVWDCATGLTKCLLQAPDGLYPDNVALAISPDQKRIACCTNRTARIWEIETGKILRTWDKLPKGLCDKLAFPGNDRLILVRVETTDPEVPPYGRADDPVRHPRLCAAYDLLEPGPLKPFRVIRDFNIAVSNTALTPDGKTLVLDGRNGTSREPFDRWIAAYDLVSGREMWRHRSSLPEENSGDLLLDPEGKLVSSQIVSRSGNSTRTLFEIATGHIQDVDFPGYRLGVDATIYETLSPHAITSKGRRRPLLQFAAGVSFPMNHIGVFREDGNTFVGVGDSASTALTLGDLAEIQRRLSAVKLGW